MNRYPQCNDCKYFIKKEGKDICKRYFQGRFLSKDTITFGVCKQYKLNEK